MVLLSETNKHPRDERIKFYEASHTYLVDSERFTSVSSFYGKYFPKFDEAKWAPIIAVRRGITVGEVKLMWKTSREFSAERGSKIHLQCEYFANDLLVLGPTPEYSQFLAFVETFHPGSKFYRTEWCIFDEHHKLAGTVDLVMKTPDDKFIIIDFKTNKEIKTSGYKGETALGPLSKLQNCDFDKYSMQQSIYRYILETHYGISIHNCFLLHLTADSYSLLKVPYHRNLVELILWNS